MWVGCGLGVGWVWVGCGLGVGWVWVGCGLGVGWGVGWVWVGCGLGVGWVWVGCGLGVGWVWVGCGHGVGLFRIIGYMKGTASYFMVLGNSRVGKQVYNEDAVSDCHELECFSDSDWERRVCVGLAPTHECRI